MNKLYNRFRGRCLPVLLFLMLMAGVVTAQEAQIQKGVLRIKIKAAHGAKLEQSSNGRVVADAKSTGIKSLNALNASYKATSMKRVFPDAGKFEARHRKHGLHLWYEVQIDSTAPAAKARADYRAIPEIEIAEPVHKKAILDYTRTKDRIFLPPVKTASAASRPGGPMNDPILERQWHYNNHGQTFGKAGTDIDLLKAWSIETGSRDVIVAIVDGGVQSDHPDLKANMWTNDREIPDNGKDDDNNGFVDDIHGFSFVDWRGAIKPHPHGTHVAGTVAAVNNNGIGVSGVAGGSGNGDGVELRRV
jgi:subtilisin family serine protease